MYHVYLFAALSFVGQGIQPQHFATVYTAAEAKYYVRCLLQQGIYARWY